MPRQDLLLRLRDPANQQDGFPMSLGPAAAAEGTDKLRSRWLLAFLRDLSWVPAIREEGSAAIETAVRETADQLRALDRRSPQTCLSDDERLQSAELVSWGPIADGYGITLRLRAVSGALTVQSTTLSAP